MAVIACAHEEAVWWCVHKRARGWDISRRVHEILLTCSDSTRSSCKQWLVSQCCKSGTQMHLSFTLAGERILPGKAQGVDLDIKGNPRMQPYDCLLRIAERRRSN